MNEKYLTTEQENIQMYKNYGISEWREKFIILGYEAAEVVKRSLDLGKDNTLVTLAKLPFPEFANFYFSQFKVAKDFVEDPGFGYKLYLLPYVELETFRNGILYYEGGRKDTFLRPRSVGYQTFNQIVLKLKMSLEMMAIQENTERVYNDIDYKFVYILKYIDTAVAQRLGLSIVPLLEADEDLGGFNIDSKLSLLNPVAREIITQSLGLYGYDRYLPFPLAKILNLPYPQIKYFVNFIMPLLKRPFGEMKSKLKVMDTIGEEKIEYGNKEYRACDIQIEYLNYLRNEASETEREILSSLPAAKAKIYIVSKHFGWTTDQVCRNMTLVPSDIEKVHAIVKKSQEEVTSKY